MNLIFHSVKLKFHDVFTIAPILFTMLSEKVHVVKLKTVKIMKSRRGLTHVHAVKLCCYAIQNNRKISWSGFGIKIAVNKEKQCFASEIEVGTIILLC